PQLSESVCVSTQAPSQTVSLSMSFRTQTLFTRSWQASHGAWHWPPAQSWPAWQTLPHPPQLFGLLDPSMHCPSQEICVGSEHPHLPAKHDSPSAQAFPQAPQFASSKFVSVHLPEQSVSPLRHAQAPFSPDFPPAPPLPH